MTPEAREMLEAKAYDYKFESEMLKIQSDAIFAALKAAEDKAEECCCKKGRKSASVGVAEYEAHLNRRTPRREPGTIEHVPKGTCK